MNRGYDWRLGKVRSIATDGKVIYDTALSMFRLSDAFEHTYDPLLTSLGTLLNPIDPYDEFYLVTKETKEQLVTKETGDKLKIVESV